MEYDEFSCINNFTNKCKKINTLNVKKQPRYNWKNLWLINY